MTTKPKLSDMSGYEADDVMVVELEEYEALKTLNAELLAALKTIANACRSILYGDDMGGMNDTELFGAVYATVRAAIAKAEGRTP